MTSDPATTVSVGSFLTGDLDHQLHAQIAQLQRYRYHHLPSEPDHTPLSADDTSPPVDLQDVQVVLLPMGSADLARWSRQSLGRWSGRSLPHDNSGPEIPALIAVLCDDSLHDAVRAAQLDFDGIIARPLTPEAIDQCLTDSLTRRDRRRRLTQRHQKLRSLCRNVNRKRRRLRQQVDLLCQDLVQSNQDLNRRVEHLRLTCDFQDSLSGQFDLHYMLHRALGRMKEQLGESSGAVYLCQTGLFEAHLTGAWYEDPRDITDMEAAFCSTTVNQILAGAAAVRVDDAGAWPGISAQHRKSLLGLTVLALPLVLDTDVIGVIVFYRAADRPFGPDDQRSLRPYLHPLARSTASILKLQGHLASL